MKELKLSKIKNSNLKDFIEDKCCENNICVEIDPLISKQDYMIIKIDKFYESLKLSNTPPSIDCLIVQKCEMGYLLHLVELKNIKSEEGFELNNLRSKYLTTFEDFIYLRNTELDIDYKKIKLYFISALDAEGKPNRDLGLKLKLLSNFKVKFKGKHYPIELYNPNPLIKAC